MYTIEVQTRAARENKRQVVGEFSDDTWNAFWDELRISEQRWRDWHAAVQSARKDSPVVPEFPQISRLAYIDEGTIRFGAKDLNDECIRMTSVVKSDATRRLIADLLEASRLALQEEDAELIVHPFGT
jgi:hypothetical protein